MRLTTKATIWTLSLALLLLLNFIVGFHALKVLQTSEQITSQHYEVSRWVHGVQTALLQFEINGLEQNGKHSNAGIIELENKLFMEFDKQIAQPALGNLYSQIKTRIHNLLQLFSADPSSFFSSEKSLLEMESIRTELHKLVLESENLVESDRLLSEKLFRRIYPLIWTVFLASLLAVVWRYFHFKRQVLTPIQSLVELIDAFRKGNMTARWNSERSDEIGDAGRTMNQLMAELSQRRRERIKFIGAVAHDIRNPLTAIGMGCDLILKKKKTLSELQIQAIIEKIKSQVSRLNYLTEDLLLAAKENRPVWQNKNRQFSLTEIATNVVELASTTDLQHAYLLNTRDSLLELHADPDRFTQVLTNLISNAAKYSPKGTEISVETGRKNSRIFIEVKDRGVGIPENKKATVFQAFNRLSSGKQMAGGTGLGLVIVKDIVESYSGNIEILNREGGGTTFRVELPDELIRGEKENPSSAAS